MKIFSVESNSVPNFPITVSGLKAGQVAVDAAGNYYVHNGYGPRSLSTVASIDDHDTPVRLVPSGTKLTLTVC